ncbi:hypothetical protein LCGC14_0902410 [marine sediment metagenome]|uniref:Uncharacterized protein n=1 Tax=marine sediment metagenome TaxID=412755 RepID=A0A0F9PGQ4_9ZZZZ
MCDAIGLDWERIRGVSGYEYLINEYIPNQGEHDMGAFIDLGFDPKHYIYWKLIQNDLLKKLAFRDALKDKLVEVFKVWPDGGRVL